MIETLSRSSGTTLGFRMTGKLRDEDYKQFVPEVDAILRKADQVRLLAWFDDFHGWDLHALWDDMQFGITHCTNIDYIALVGDRKWEEWMAKICRPFTLAKTRYFDSSELNAAWEWLEAQAPSPRAEE
jgi:hypothetical protein